MFTFQLNAGLASNYFVTDVKKCIGSIEKSYLVFSDSTLNDTLLAEILTTIYNISFSSGLSGLGAKKLNGQQFELLLDDLRNERKPSTPLSGFKNPVLILSNGFDKKTLTVIKILKIRGLCQILAIDISALAAGSAAVKLGSELLNLKIEEKLSYKIYKPDNRLVVVSGLNKTVLSTESSVGQILKKYPDLSSNINLESVNEPLF